MAAQPQATQQITGLALLKQETVDLVASNIRKYLERGELQLPKSYSAENALKAAWLILQNAETTDKKPVLTSCTKHSIVNSLLDMVVQGLNPSKKQCYFIPYGLQLTCQRSYHGTMAVARMVNSSIEDIVAEVVYEGDEFAYRIERGQKFITNHEQQLGNVDPQKIVAAYCIVFYGDGRSRTTIMTLREIYQSWRQSRMKPFDDKGNLRPDSTHAKFPADMCMRSVITKACKPIINASNDSHLFQDAVHRSDDIATDVEVAEEISAQANGEIIDIDGQEIAGALPGSEPEEAPVAEPDGSSLFGDRRPTIDAPF